MKRNSGFTLIEVLVVIAIIGILGSIAFSNYSDYLIRSRVAEASSQLADLRVKMEQYYQDNRNYGSSATTCGVTMPTTSVKYFTYTCNWGATATNQGFRITAASAAGAGLGAAGDYTYTVDQDNTKATTKFGGTARTDACWITAKGQSC